MARPKKCGWWGIKYMFSFAKALMAKSLWNFPFDDGI